MNKYTISNPSDETSASQSPSPPFRVSSSFLRTATMVAAKKTVSSLSFSAINVLDLVVVLNSKSILMGLCFVGFDLENAEEDP